MDPDDRIESVDVLVMRVAYLAFLQTPWHWPLFFVPGLGAPLGTNVTFLDIIPIVALTGKVIATLTGVVVNPYGVWVAACFVMPPVLATGLLRALGQTSMLAAFSGSLLAVSMPCLLYRFGHMSLLGQFIIIGALWRYVCDLRTPRSRRCAAWLFWLCLAVLVHPYLLAMTAAIYAAALLRRFPAERQVTLLEPGIAALSLAAMLLLCGYIGASGVTSSSASGFGYFSMNLLSPLWPQRSGLFPGFYALVTGRAGQYEGFNYLGMGVILLLGTAAVVTRRADPGLLRRHRTLLIVLLGLTLFALSNVVFAGKWLVFFLPLPEPLLYAAGIFRSSGRMFWPCAYALALFGLALVLRHMRPGWKSVVVLGCCMLQFLDTTPLRARITTLTQSRRPMVLDQAEWQVRMRNADQVHVTPSFGCGRLALDAVELELQMAAVIAGRPINVVYNPRLVNDCPAEAQAAIQGPWDIRTLYVFLRASDKETVPPDWRPPDLACQAFPEGFWCLGAEHQALR